MTANNEHQFQGEAVFDMAWIEDEYNGKGVLENMRYAWDSDFKVIVETAENNIRAVEARLLLVHDAFYHQVRYAR